tara:strand:+ start:2035 stop:2229 length:195 start_codon:yes stop_codon:yes gene_type:complete
MADLEKIQDRINSLTGSNDYYQIINDIIDPDQDLSKENPESIILYELVQKIDELITEVNILKNA